MAELAPENEVTSRRNSEAPIAPNELYPEAQAARRTSSISEVQLEKVNLEHYFCILFIHYYPLHINI